MPSSEQFSNRWGIVLASLGMAVGAGNLWRFPRLAGQYGGTFLLLWILFLLIWSIPILLAEFAIGKQFKRAVIGSFAGVAGKRFTWMGVFITVCTLGITFYYSVVSGWALHYLVFSIQNAFQLLPDGKDLQTLLAENPAYLQTHWASISNRNWLTVILHILSVAIGIFVLYRGIQKGLEKVNKILIPILFLMLLMISAIALNMDNGINGLDYMFSVKWELFGDAKVWLEALSQSAWSTGAGWGLIMTISSYSRSKEDVTLNTFIGGFGNNTASLVAGIAILPAVFALAESDTAAISFLQSGNQALTFMIIPKLFAQISGGSFLSIFFFTAFFLAAFSSLLPMLELFIKTLGDWKLPRQQATLITGFCCIIAGFPSAWSFDFFNNQDWVWGIGLIVSGNFIVFAALKYGASTFKKQFIDLDSDFKVPDMYFISCLFINILLGITLIYWWMSQGYSKYPWFNEAGFWNMFDVYSNATIITQWGLVILTAIIFNALIYKKINRS